MVGRIYRLQGLSLPWMCFLSWAYQVPLFASVRTEVNPPIVLVEIADPQLGMLNMYKKPENWKDEETMLQKLVAKAASMKPDLVFLAGDMQNWWPNEKGTDRNRIKSMTDAQFAALKAKDLGKMQRQSVRDAMSALTDAGIAVCYTPGNHDVGDDPDEKTLGQYTSSSSENPGWGPLFQRVKEENGIVFLQFNSQVYWSENSEILDKYRKEQFDFLESEINSLVAKRIKRLVLLTHIPPFMDTIEEEEGWANWKKEYRKKLLDLFVKVQVPMLFVCGHFHANVVKDTTYKDLELSIRVSSAAGTTIQWDGKDALSPEEAQKVASKNVMSAFAEDVGFANIRQRLRAEPDRSGLRTFHFNDDGSFEDHWYTLDELDNTP